MVLTVTLHSGFFFHSKHHPLGRNDFSIQALQMLNRCRNFHLSQTQIRLFYSIAFHLFSERNLRCLTKYTAWREGLWRSPQMSLIIPNIMERSWTLSHDTVNKGGRAQPGGEQENMAAWVINTEDEKKEKRKPTKPY